MHAADVFGGENRQAGFDPRASRAVEPFGVDDRASVFFQLSDSVPQRIGLVVVVKGDDVVVAEDDVVEFGISIPCSNRERLSGIDFARPCKNLFNKG